MSAISGAAHGSASAADRSVGVPFGALADEILGRAAFPRMSRRRSSPSPGASRRASASFTGRWSFPRSSATRSASRVRPQDSTPSSEIRRGRCCAATAAMRDTQGRGADAPPRGSRTSRAGQASTRRRATGTSTSINCSSSARSRSLRHGGRLGMVLPSGLATDRGAATSATGAHGPHRTSTA